MPDWEFPRSSLSKRWNVARLTSEISSSSSVGTRNGAASCQSRSATDPAGGDARDAGGIYAGDPPVDAAKDIPAIPSTDTALLGRFPFEARFACGIAEFLLDCPSTKIRDELYKRMHPLALFCDYGLRFSISFTSVKDSLPRTATGRYDPFGKSSTNDRYLRACGHALLRLRTATTPKRLPAQARDLVCRAVIFRRKNLSAL
jgi:hypothetical protein